MVKNYNPRPFEQFSPLPSYVTVVEQYELLAETKSGYTITLARLSIGQSTSAGKQLIHVLFESFSDHGKRMITARTRASGFGREFSAVMNAMMDAGVEFEAITPCHFEMMLAELGLLIRQKNPDIEHYEIVSQNCH